jgi:alginate O-acetyltransferase complex protein AlgI
MELQTASYFLFLGVVALAHSLLAPRWRPPLMLGASLAFYAMSGVAYMFMFLMLCTLNYRAALTLSRADDDGRARSIVFGGILVLNLAVLVSFKYSIGLIESALGSAGLPLHRDAAVKLAAPLGISYFTFQMIACTTDAYRRDWKLSGDWGQFLLSGFFFLQITSGPIPRAERLFPQLSVTPAATPEDVAVGLRLIAYGLFKKLVVANRLNDYVTEIFATPGDALSLHYSTLPTILGCIFNVLNLYADFSSYVDIAIGSARLIGIRLDPNFDHPLMSTSITELWRRWHMTLSFWLRDYLFMPLLIRIGGLGNSGVVFALLFTFAICGIWHGATWPFLLFGVVQGLAMSIELLTKRWRARRLKRVPERSINVAAWLYAMSFFVLSEVFFRASNLSNAWMVFSRLFHLRLIDSAPELFAHKGPFDFILYFVAVGTWFIVAHFFRRVAIMPTSVFVLVCALLTLFFGHLGSGRFIYAGF